MRSVTDALKWQTTVLGYCVDGSFIFLCSSTIVLGSLSLLSDACQRKKLESWLGGYGLVVV